MVFDEVHESVEQQKVESTETKSDRGFSGKMGSLVGCCFTACIAVCLCACMIAATISFIDWILL